MASSMTAAPTLTSDSSASDNRPTAPGATTIERLADLDAELRAPVLHPAVFGARAAHGTLAPEARDGDALGGDALGHQPLAHRLRAPLPEGDVVLVGAALVTVALDQHDGIR